MGFIIHKKTAYAYVSALVRSRSSKVIPLSKYLSLLGKNKIYDMVLELEQYIIGEYLSTKLTPEATIYDFERELWSHLHDEVMSLWNFLPRQAREFILAYISKYDVLNIKSILRGIVFDKKVVTKVPFGVARIKGMIEQFDNVGGVRELVELVYKLGFNDYARVISSLISRLESKDTEALWLTECLLDRAYVDLVYRSTLKYFKRDYLLRKAVGVIADLYSIGVALRGSILGIPKNIVKQAFSERIMNISEQTLVELVEADSPDKVSQILSATPYYYLSSLVSKALASGLGDIALEASLIKALYKEVHDNLLSNMFSVQSVLDYILLKENELAILRLMAWITWNNIPLDMVRKYIEELIVR